ncbi:MAG: hypothetical protein JNK05_16885, partial [Myxococcales bacterium]|nr:hypothetical protein [Myxococcales bacterium]
LRDKIEEYFGAGAKWVWVVRLKGERCVEVYSAPGVFTTRSGMDPIEAQGVLALPVPAAALYDRSVALDVSLRNLLRRAGYRDIDEIRQEGVAQGRAMQLRATIVDLCELLEIAIDPTRRARIADADVDALEALYAEIKRARRWPDDG